jgi:hypothetical protein
MSFINAEPFFGILQSYRLIWICGKFGGHKTALAVSMSEIFLKQGYRLVTNCRTVWADDMENVKLDKDGHLKAVVMLDEGGLYFKTSRQIEEIASYAAKMDCIYMIPSFWPPTRAAQVLTVQPLFSLKPAGLPVIVYKWRADLGGWHDKGYFVWLFPQEVYGIYSRKDPGARPEKIIDFLIERKNEYRKRYDRETDNSVSNLEAIQPEDIFADSVSNLAATVDEFAAVSTRKRGRR